MNSNPQTGVVVTGLTPGGLVERSGVMVGDIVYAVNGMRVLYAIETTEILKSAPAGTLMLDLVRGALLPEESSELLLGAHDPGGEDPIDDPILEEPEEDASNDACCCCRCCCCCFRCDLLLLLHTQTRRLRPLPRRPQIHLLPTTLLSLPPLRLLLPPPKRQPTEQAQPM